MKNEIILDGRPVQLKGHVILDYVRNDKILERIEGDNVCFENSFNLNRRWLEMLYNYPTLRISSSGKPANFDLPYPRTYPFQLGYGTRGETATGTERGAWNAAKSYDGKRINNGNGISFKWAYDWNVTQMLRAPIKSLGIGGTNADFRMLSARPIKHSPTTFSYAQGGVISKGYLGYRIISQTGREIEVHHLKEGLIFNPIDLTQIIPETTTNNDTYDYWALGFAQDENNTKAYVMLKNSRTGTNVESGFRPTRHRLFEFEDDTFTNLLQSYDISALPLWANLDRTWNAGNFGVYGDEIFQSVSTGIQAFNFKTNEMTEIFQASPCYPLRQLLLKNNYYIPLGHYDNAYDITTQAHNIFNMKDREFEPEKIFYFRQNESYNDNYAYIDTAMPHSPIVYQGNSFVRDIPWMSALAYQMMTCYVLPEDAPERPEDSGVSIDYQIDILFV